VGAIPEDWTTISLSAIGSFSKGKGVRKSEANSGNLPCVRYGEIYTNHHDIIRNFYSQISFDVAQRSKRLTKGDILFAGSGETKQEIGKAAAFVWDGEAYAGGDIVILSPRAGDSAFLGYLLNSPLCVRQKASKGQGDAVVHISASALAAVIVPNPPLPEQRAIASALSDVDALLDGLDRLIAKKRDLKQAAMQQLLTGQTRLPGFHGEWEAKRLVDLGHFLKGSGVKKDEARSGEIACIRYGEIYTHHHNHIRSFNSWISRDVAKTATRLKQGDLLFAGSGETKEEIGKCVAFVDDIEAYAGGDIAILRAPDANSVFLGYLLNSPATAAQKASRGQGDAVVHISANALASIELSLPTHAEQAAIATVLSDMDAELTVLEARRDKTRALKRGMMQELLTGRTRLVRTEYSGAGAC
jgi:type I restriction enzyme S subunit